MVCRMDLENFSMVQRAVNSLLRYGGVGWVACSPLSLISSLSEQTYNTFHARGPDLLILGAVN